MPLVIGAVLVFFLLSKMKISVPYQSDILEFSSKWGIPSALAIAQVAVESAFNPNARNKVSGARGLMQVLQPALADTNEYLGTDYTFDDMYNVRKNLEIGFAYLHLVQQRFNGSLWDAFSWYYAGSPSSPYIADGKKYADTVFNKSKDFA